MHSLLKAILEAIKKRGFKITIKRPWPGEKDLPPPRAPWDHDKIDPMDQIIESLNREYLCRGCDRKKKSAEICRCLICGKFFCKKCYTLIDGKAWCKECLKKAKPQE